MPPTGDSETEKRSVKEMFAWMFSGMRLFSEPNLSLAADYGSWSVRGGGLTPGSNRDEYAQRSRVVR